MSPSPFHDTLHCATIRHGSADYAETIALRDAILRKPLRLQLTDEQLRAESADHHLACFAGGRIVACLILTPEAQDRVRMRQVAVAADLQRQGVGTTLVRYAERFAAERGYTEITAHARESALPFYRKLGYAVTGEPSIEVGIPHMTVHKTLA
jgi:ribosomal protein S18 acetylase RimI-like enzyme